MKRNVRLRPCPRRARDDSDQSREGYSNGRRRSSPVRGEGGSVVTELASGVTVDTGAVRKMQRKKYPEKRRMFVGRTEAPFAFVGFGCRREVAAHGLCRSLMQYTAECKRIADLQRGQSKLLIELKPHTRQIHKYHRLQSKSLSSFRTTNRP